MRARSIFLFASLFIAALAFAHAGHEHHFMGTVRQVQMAKLTIATVDGHEMSFALNNETRYERGTDAAKQSDVKPGMRVAVEVNDDGHTARVVKLGHG
jgi:hypothetical protein